MVKALQSRSMESETSRLLSRMVLLISLDLGHPPPPSLLSLSPFAFTGGLISCAGFISQVLLWPKSQAYKRKKWHFESKNVALSLTILRLLSANNALFFFRFQKDSRLVLHLFSTWWNFPLLSRKPLCTLIYGPPIRPTLRILAGLCQIFPGGWAAHPTCLRAGLFTGCKSLQCPPSSPATSSCSNGLLPCLCLESGWLLWSPAGTPICPGCASTSAAGVQEAAVG